jgi:Tetratricopeptide repeat/TPR repeat
MAISAVATLLTAHDELSAHGSIGRRRFRSWWIRAAAALFGMLIAGCSSQPKYPRQTITVLPPPEASAVGQYPPSEGPAGPYAVSPETPPQIPGQPVYPQIPRPAPGEAGETRPQVPGETAPPLGAPPEGMPPRTVAIPGMSRQSHYNQGVLLFRSGDVDGAIAQFRLAVAQNPSDVKARDNLGVLLAQTGDSHGAIEQYQAALQIDPSNKLSHRLLARAYAQSGDIGDSIDQYEATVKLDPNDAGAHNDFGVALHIRGDDRAARWRSTLATSPPIATWPTH